MLIPNNCEPGDGLCVPDFKIMSLNVWGLPGLIARDKPPRMRGIVEVMKKSEFDLYLFQELWQRDDYGIIQSGVPEGYHITGRLYFGTLCANRESAYHYLHPTWHEVVGRENVVTHALPNLTCLKKKGRGKRQCRVG